jgi:DNA-directed RNA polymerase specialized sigma24 family protein
MLQLLLNSGQLGPQLLRQFDGKEGPDHFKPSLFMTVRREMVDARDKREERDSRDALALFYLVALFPQVSPVPLGLIEQPAAKEIQCGL